MATKPTDQPPLWASNTNWSTGPNAGTENKSKTAADIAAADGHIAGAANPSAADVQNSVQNRTTALSRWTFLGTSAADQNAHLVETNSNGKASIVQMSIPGHSIQAGPSLFVGESQGATNSLNVEGGTNEATMRCLSTGIGSAINALSDGTAVTLNVDGRGVLGTNTAPGIVVQTLDNVGVVIAAFTGSGDAKGLDVTARNGAGGGSVFKNDKSGLNACMIEGVAGSAVGVNGITLTAHNGDALTPGGWGANLTGGNNGSAIKAGNGLLATGGENTGALGPGGTAIQATGGNGILASGGEALLARSNLPSANIIDARTTNAASSGACVYAEAQNFAAAIKAVQVTGKEAAIVATATSTGPDVSAPLLLTPQTVDLASQGAKAGSIYMLDGGSSMIRPRVYLSQRTSLTFSPDPSCFAYATHAQKLTSVTNDVDVDIATFNFDSPDGIPLEAGQVRVTVNFTVRRDTNTSPIGDVGVYRLEVVDNTAGDAQMMSVTPDLMTSASAIAKHIRTRVVASGVYTLPASGQRTFKARHRKIATGFSNVIEMENLTVEIRPHRRM